MQIQKKVVERIQQMLQEEFNKCNAKLFTNKYTFKRLVEEQTVLKRERVKLTEMLNELKKGGNK